MPNFHVLIHMAHYTLHSHLIDSIKSTKLLELNWMLCKWVFKYLKLIHDKLQAWINALHEQCSVCLHACVRVCLMCKREILLLDLQCFVWKQIDKSVICWTYAWVDSVQQSTHTAKMMMMKRINWQWVCVCVCSSYKLIVHNLRVCDSSSTQHIVPRSVLVQKKERW